MFTIFLQMIINLILTIVIELFISLLLGVRKKIDIINIIFINCITNIILNYLINIISYFLYPNMFMIYFILVILELIIIIVEYIFYKRNLEYNKINPLILSIILNTLSFGIGLLII